MPDDDPVDARAGLGAFADDRAVAVHLLRQALAERREDRRLERLEGEGAQGLVGLAVVAVSRREEEVVETEERREAPPALGVVERLRVGASAELLEDHLAAPRVDHRHARRDARLVDLVRDEDHGDDPAAPEEAEVEPPDEPVAADPGDPVLDQVHVEDERGASAVGELAEGGPARRDGLEVGAQLGELRDLDRPVVERPADEVRDPGLDLALVDRRVPPCVGEVGLDLAPLRHERRARDRRAVGPDVSVERIARPGEAERDRPHGEERCLVRAPRRGLERLPERRVLGVLLERLGRRHGAAREEQRGERERGPHLASSLTHRNPSVGSRSVRGR